MFKKISLVLVSVSFVASAAYAQPERFMDRASDHATQVPQPKKIAKLDKTKEEQQNTEAANGSAPKQRSRAHRFGAKAPNGLR